ncbi:hypothetical protein CC86DRAFT_369373 [Ophiobolus disseminans]|uniref:Uncharacterized protein n=1 Tax=Ophiobolus disseminans TaxID=1469910 RepID=A0A6A7A206_9PLEO|nr:hypothetical protein CC86DRAFT_369373 [Ophiobolus disseminans]
MDSGSRPFPPQYSRISSWLASAHESFLPPTPPPDNDSGYRPAPSKRKRAMSLPVIAPVSSPQRSDSPKRQRTDNTDDVQPE